MNTSLPLLPDNYLRQLLALSDEVKLFIINRLSASLLSAEGKTEEPQSHEASTAEWIDSLSVKGGEPVPEDVNDIQSLIEAKYAK
ncbi:hypothetical protein B5F34_06420 [Mediterranea sp. An20]|uniref:hypothetical protein n=1 Tax=Mediterranea sp. An20 TaxID=1965586 RepID=UPI000B3A3783|nr:hypothetical protein [Mediterranea sp. An20]OUP09683.1 hypothetical protein B5F34_06420 [Mediterranea sp. An20]